MSHQFISSAAQLDQLCKKLADAPWLAFDTEFVSEFTYRPVLCLVQVAWPEGLAAIDTLAVRDVRPLWETLADGQRETIVHAGRGELVFSLEAIGRPPVGLVDVQLAAALIGLEYPAGYGTLVSRLLGKAPRKGETRTDWRRRPLTSAQIDYAIEDVRWLHELWRKIHDRLTAQGRVSWLAHEQAAWQAEVADSLVRERWRRVSGAAGLSVRELAIVREVWRWRETEAERRDMPPRKLLRDDLIVELAKRRHCEGRQIRAVRGMERGDLRDVLDDLGQCVARALALPDNELPASQRRGATPQHTMLCQLLQSALTSVCRQREVATSLVGTAEDVRSLVEYRLHGRTDADGQLPALMRDWRAEVVGELLDDLLAGRISIRIGDPLAEQPLTFERREG